MAGVKGKSGRKSTTEESKRLRILNKAWDIVESQFDNPDLDIKVKLDIASKLVVKDMPQVVEGMEQSQTVVMSEIKRSDGLPLRYDIGSRNITQDITDSSQAISDN